MTPKDSITLAAVLAELRGSPNDIVKIVKELAKKHNARHGATGWVLDNPPPVKDDPWAFADPWSQARSGSTMNSMALSRPTQHALDGQDGNDLRPFEELTLITKFSLASGTVLTQTERHKYEIGQSAVIMCHQDNFLLLAAGLDVATQVLVVVNALSADLIKWFNASRAQIVVMSQPANKSMSVVVVSYGPQKVNLLQTAWELTVVEAQAVLGTLRIRKQDVSDEEFYAAGHKEALSKYVGSMVQSVSFTTRKFDDNGLRWTFECPRSQLASLLKTSGTGEASIGVSKQEEAKLDIQPVFVSASSAMAVRTLLGDLRHLGVVGPTKAGFYVVRAYRDSVAAVRKAVLTPTSAFANGWDVVVQNRYVAKFPAKYSLQTVASTLKASLNWTCVGLSQRQASKHFKTMVFGAAERPPTCEVALDGHVIILQEQGTKDDTQFATTFLPPPRQPKASEQPEAMQVEEPVKATSDALQQVCDAKMASIESRLAAKMDTWQTKLASDLRASDDQIGKVIDQKLAASEAKVEASLDKMNVEVVRHSAKMAELESTTQSSMQGLKGQVSTLTVQCESKFMQVEASLAEQAKILKTTNENMQHQFKALGNDLLSQIAKIQGDGGSSKKKRQGDPEHSNARGSQDGRGGASDDESEQFGFHERVQRNRAAVMQHCAVGQSTSSSSTSSSSSSSSSSTSPGSSSPTSHPRITGKKEIKNSNSFNFGAFIWCSWVSGCSYSEPIPYPPSSEMWCHSRPSAKRGYTSLSQMHQGQCGSYSRMDVDQMGTCARSRSSHLVGSFNPCPGVALLVAPLFWWLRHQCKIALKKYLKTG